MFSRFFKRKETTMAKQYSKYPEMVIDESKAYSGTIRTNKGNIEFELFTSDAPKTVNNFVFLARDGFYDGITFHRVIPGFMAQGGDPAGTGRGGPGYKFEDEVGPGNVPHRHETGVLSMANAGPNSNGSQFFITYAPQPHLDGKHTVFGRVTSGMEVVTSLKNGDQMESVEIHEG
jgi:peptidyl-prolyl cis-trans isomerase B (cyclophilin B)